MENLLDMKWYFRHPDVSNTRSRLTTYIPSRILGMVVNSRMIHLLKLKPTEDLAFPSPAQNHQYSLYVHIPFCETLCPYCTFHRFKLNDSLARNYFLNLGNELLQYSKLGYVFQSVYIGGGTPTILLDELVKTIDLIKDLFHPSEISCETNPNHLSDIYVNQLTNRVDRLSIGVQSFNDQLLSKIGRLEKYGTGQEIKNKVQGVLNKFKNVNIDMIYNFPGQTEELLINDIQQAISTEAHQITFYPLMNMPSGKHLDWSEVRENTYREMRNYDLINDQITKTYKPISAWTYALNRDVMVDEYITKYFEYVGAGSGSFSFINGSLYVNTFSLLEYDKRIKGNIMPTSFICNFPKTAQMQYQFMMELFDLSMDIEKFKSDFGTWPQIGLWKEYFFLMFWSAFIPGCNGVLRLNPKQQYLMVVMMKEFFRGVNRLRQQARASLQDYV